MKILIQDLISLRYLGMDGEWTEDCELAIDFGDVPRAVEIVLLRRLENVRVLIKFPESAGDVELPPVHVARF